MGIRIGIRWLFGCLILVGCFLSQPAHVSVEASAFELTADGCMRVREDLVSMLVWEPAQPTEVVAELECFGRATFAPGASYALRVPFDGIIESVETKVLVQTGE